jgi:hypothetical protein
MQKLKEMLSALSQSKHAGRQAEIQGSHGGEEVDHGLPGCDVL